MQDDMVNCGNPFEDGDAVLDASTIASYKPITGELRSFIRRATSTIDTCWWTASDTQEVYQLCDAIDAVHAQLESDYKTACEVNERQDGSRIELLRQNESLRKKLANVREQLTNVQKALEDRNNGVLKQRWQKKCDALNGEIESLKKEVLSLKEQLTAAKDEDQSHAYAPESHYMMLPKDADGVPIHVGDVLTDGECRFKVFEMAAFVDGSWSIRGVNGNAWAACDVTHYVADTWERIIMDAVCGGDEDELVARCKALAGES